MSVITDAIIGGIAWEAFSKWAGFYVEKINEMAMKADIALRLRSLDKLKDVQEEQIDEIAEIIETAIIETPEEIKKIEDKSEQKEKFLDYLQKNSSIKAIYAKNYVKKIIVKDGGTVNFS